MKVCRPDGTAPATPTRRAIGAARDAARARNLRTVLIVAGLLALLLAVGRVYSWWVSSFY